MEVAAAIIGVMDVALRASSKLWKLSSTWRDAPAEIHALRDDMTRTENFFGEIQQSIKTIGWATHTEPGEQSALQADLAGLIEDGTAILRRIEAVVDVLDVSEVLDRKPNSNGIWDREKKRRLLWLRYSMKVSKLRKELCHTRSSICRLLIAQNISLSTSIYTSVQRLHGAQVAAISVALEDSHGALIARLDSRLQDLESRMILPLRQDSGKVSLDTVKAPVRDRPHGTPSPITPCGIGCSCLCHYPASFSWRLEALAAQRFLGTVALAYSSWSSQPCTNAACRRIQRAHAGKNFQILYHFPDWLARISISAFVSSNIHGHPQFNIRIHHPRSMAELQDSEGVAWLIVRGDSDGVKKALQEGRASIYDVFGPVLLSPLRIAIGRNHYAVAKLLLQAGADPFEKTDPVVGRSAVEVAFQLSIAGDSIDKETASLFPLSRYMEEGEFSPLHLAVLEVLQVDLIKALQKPEYKMHVNRKSTDGWTPIHLAALRGHLLAAKLLVQSGADVNVQTPQGTTPLFFACLYGHVDVARVLLQAGANLEDRDTFGRTALHGAAMCKTGNSRRLLSVLTRHGADLNSVDCDGGSALTYIINWGGSTDALEFLLEQGVSPERRDPIDGSTVIVEAVWAMSHRVAEVVLSHGCDVSVRTTDGRGLLHHLAVCGDEEMFGIFANNSAAIRRLSTSARDGQGKTPLQLFNEQEPSPELRDAFEKLLDVVERGDDDVSEDEFFDASDGLSDDLHRYITDTKGGGDF